MKKGLEVDDNMKKGFTLIELLAVMVILAIISLIVIPKTLTLINQSKTNVYDVSVDNIIKAAQIYNLENQIDNADLLMDINIYDNLLKEIKGEKPTEGKVYINSNGKVAIALKYGDWCYKKAYYDNNYKKEKTDDCVVPFYYLKVADITSGTGAENIGFLYSDPSKLKKPEVGEITFLPTTEVPEDADYSWSVSEVEGKIMAWYKNEEKKDGLYHVYIGQTGGVKANEDSSRLFSYLINVKKIDLKYLDTSNAKDMQIMFNKCYKLKELDLSNFDTSNATNMRGLFKSCSSLEELDVSNFDTSNVTNMDSMFGVNGKDIMILKSIKGIENFDTSNVTDMKGMFNQCGSLTELDLSSFDTSNVTNMQLMFQACRSLTELDLSSFDTSNVTDMSYMFNVDGNLTKIYIGSKWVTSSNNQEMFNLCGTSELTLK